MAGDGCKSRKVNLEDVELSFRLARNGSPIVCLSHAAAKHSHPESLVAYLKRKFRYVRAAPALHRVTAAARAANAKHGVFAVLGNHEYWTNKKIVLTALKESGVPVLMNNGLALNVGQEMLYLAGLDDGWQGHPDLSKALEKRPGKVPTILLVHEPDCADVFSTDGTVSLQLSGHSHGGQIRLPGVGALVLPRYGRKYDQGLYRVQDMWTYTTRGIGVIGPPIRFNCRPEITEITLVRA